MKDTKVGQLSLFLAIKPAVKTLRKGKKSRIVREEND